MASFLFQQRLPISLLLLLIPLLISPAHSLKCTSQNFTGGSTHYTNCTDLPSLNAYLHWTYESTNKTLSIAFIAPPPKSDGWVAWAINPTAAGMAGAQALLAYKAANGSMVVKTYNISSYSSVVESKVWFDVLDKKAEFSGGVIRIFAKLALPESLTTVNQVWQVGPSGKAGPEKHEFKPENLNAKGTLQLVEDAGEISPAPSPSPGASGPSGNGTRQSGRDNAGCGRTWNKGFLSFYGFLLLWGILVLGF
ncbi:cytochrome b561 and DOMON domain-containing protein At3g25290-like [Coffea arabica]|uniref:Cytochrome b561 and DOMON domain-containing protein At3g25290-like n=1 Tax=Coffea arabica TaxID=13443 RepID=A0A6P6XJ40_COFAR|nr:auxin-induced in root cultures protein 12-like [Coffea arabica]